MVKSFNIVDLVPEVFEKLPESPATSTFSSLQTRFPRQNSQIGYKNMMILALESSPERMMTSTEICGWIENNFGELLKRRGWKRTVQCYLSKHSEFERKRDNGGHYWTWNPNLAKQGRKTAGSLSALQRYRPETHSPITFKEMIILALASSPEKKMTLGQIEGWIGNNFRKLVADGNNRWMDKVHRTLSLCFEFERKGKNGNKDCFWTWNPANFKENMTPKKQPNQLTALLADFFLWPASEPQFMKNIQFQAILEYAKTL